MKSKVFITLYLILFLGLTFFLKLNPGYGYKYRISFFSILYLGISFLGIIGFLILSINHWRIRGRVFKKSNYFAGVLLTSLILIDLFAHFLSFSQPAGYNCRSFVMLQGFVPFLVIPLFIISKNISHPIIVFENFFYFSLFLSLLVLKVTCSTHDFSHNLYNHFLPLFCLIGLEFFIEKRIGYWRFTPKN